MVSFRIDGKTVAIDALSIQNTKKYKITLSKP